MICQSCSDQIQFAVNKKKIYHSVEMATQRGSKEIFKCTVWQTNGQPAALYADTTSVLTMC
jgi:hypothetical protein